MNFRKSPFVDYKGVRVFAVFKGDKLASYAYGLVPKLQVEGDDRRFFDIRKLPARYRRGIQIHIDFEPAKAAPDAGYVYEADKANEIFEAHLESHRVVLKRAIDDGYDLVAATLGSYNWLQRLIFGSKPPKAPSA